MFELFASKEVLKAYVGMEAAGEARVRYIVTLEVQKDAMNQLWRKDTRWSVGDVCTAVWVW
jgi:hypothetical protein